MCIRCRSPAESRVAALMWFIICLEPWKLIRNVFQTLRLFECLFFLNRMKQSHRPQRPQFLLTASWMGICCISNLRDWCSIFNLFTNYLLSTHFSVCIKCNLGIDPILFCLKQLIYNSQPAVSSSGAGSFGHLCSDRIC